jgi:hypothetical protein
MRKISLIVCKSRLCLPKGPINSASAALQRHLQKELILWINLVYLKDTVSLSRPSCLKRHRIRGYNLLSPLLTVAKGVLPVSIIPRRMYFKIGRIHCIHMFHNFNVVILRPHCTLSLAPWIQILFWESKHSDRLCGLVVRVPGYRSSGPGFDSSATRFSEK